MSTVYTSLKIKMLNYSYVTLVCLLSDEWEAFFRHHPDDDYPLSCSDASPWNKHENCCSLNTRNAYGWKSHSKRILIILVQSAVSLEISNEHLLKRVQEIFSKMGLKKCLLALFGHLLYVTYFCTIIYVWQRTWSTQNVQTGERMMQTETETMNE